jgi:hypothetical protein
MNSRNRPEPVNELDVMIRKSLKALVRSRRPAIDVRQTLLRKAYAQRRSWFWPMRLAPIPSNDPILNYGQSQLEPNLTLLVYVGANRLFRPMSFPGQML